MERSGNPGRERFARQSFARAACVDSSLFVYMICVIHSLCPRDEGHALGGHFRQRTERVARIVAGQCVIVCCMTCRQPDES